jgi:hypothetical protein
MFDQMEEYPKSSVSNIVNLPTISTPAYGITVTASSMDTTSNYTPRLAFNKVSTGSSVPWRSAKSFHNTNLIYGTLTYTTRVNGVLIGKQWLSLDVLLPQAFTGFKMGFLANNMIDRPKNYHVVGSNDNVNFTSLFHTSNEKYNGNSAYHGLENTTAYRYYRLVILDVMDSTNNENHYTYVEELRFFKPYPRDDFASLLLLAQNTKADLDRFINLINSFMAAGKIVTNSLGLFGDIIRLNWLIP